MTQKLQDERIPEGAAVQEDPASGGEFDQAHGEGSLGVLVVGGGIAGIQAALDLAEARVPVTLVERSPTLGGRMAQLDKTFPTMDCSI